jgi:hypothetical protein
MAPGIVSDIELPRDIPESQLSAANVPIEKAFGLKNRTIIITGAGRGLGYPLVGVRRYTDVYNSTDSLVD